MTDYLLWFIEQSWANTYPLVQAYVLKNERQLLDEQARES